MMPEARGQSTQEWVPDLLTGGLPTTTKRAPPPQRWAPSVAFLEHKGRRYHRTDSCVALYAKRSIRAGAAETLGAD